MNKQISPTRRRVLQTGTTCLLLGLAGCNSLSDQQSAGENPTTNTGDASPKPSERSAPSATTPSVPKGLWPIPTYDTAGSFHNPHVVLNSEPSVQWQVSIEGEYQAYPLFSNDRLYISDGLYFNIIDTEDQQAVSGRLPMQLLAVWDDTLYFSVVEEETTAAINPEDMLTLAPGSQTVEGGSKTVTEQADDSNLYWQIEYAIGIGKRAGDFFYGVTRDDRFVALATASGDQQWTHNLSFQPSDFVVTQEGVILYNDTNILALDRENGEMQWSVTPDPEQVLEAVELDEGIQDMIEGPEDLSLQFGGVTVGGGNLLVGEIDSRYSVRVVSGRDLSTGEPIWFQQPATVYGATDDRFFSQFEVWDANNGDPLWDVGSEPPFGTTAPISAIATQNHIIVAASQGSDSEGGRLVAFNQSDGSQSWSLDTEHRIWRCIAVDDTLFATTNAGNLLAIS